MGEMATSWNMNALDSGQDTSQLASKGSETISKNEGGQVHFLGLMEHNRLGNSVLTAIE